METLVHTPDSDQPCTIAEVLAALEKQGLKAKHEAKHWGDWIYLEGSDTVISIESMRGLTSRATIEHGEAGDDPTPAILSAFHQLGWIGSDEDGEFALG